MGIAQVNIPRWTLFYLKVGEWVTRRVQYAYYNDVIMGAIAS